MLPSQALNNDIAVQKNSNSLQGADSRLLFRKLKDDLLQFLAFSCACLQMLLKGLQLLMQYCKPSSHNMLFLKASKKQQTHKGY